MNEPYPPFILPAGTRRRALAFFCLLALLGVLLMAHAAGAL